MRGLLGVHTMITLCIVIVICIAFGAGFYFGWNDGAGWVRSQLPASNSSESNR